MSREAKQLLGKCQSQLKSYPGITTNQKKLLIEYTGSCQVNFFVLSLTQNPLHVSRLIELFLHNLLFQLSIVEFLKEGIKYDIFTLRDCRVTNIVENKSKWLGELKYFRHKKILSLKKISMVSVIKKKQQCAIYFTTDLLIQQLFVSVLNPRVMANTELNDYNLKKNKILIRGADKTRNSLGYKLSMNSEMLWHLSLGSCSHSFSYVLLLKNIFVPLKYEYIFQSWFCMRQVRHSLAQNNLNNLTMSFIGLLSFLWMNSIFTGIYQLVCGMDIEFKTRTCGKLAKKFSSNAVKLFLQSNVFARRWVCWDFWRGTRYFVVLSNSRKLLNALIRKIRLFLLLQGLWMPMNICRIFWVRVNSDSYFLRSIFSCSTRSKTVKKWSFCIRHKAYKSQLQRKSPSHPFANDTDLSTIFCRMREVVRWNYSIYTIVSALNCMVIEWIDFWMLNFQRIWDLVKFGVERQWVKKFRTIKSKHNLFIRCFSFQNHFETLRHLTKVKSMFLTKNFSRGFLGVSKKKFKYLHFGVPKITAIWGLSGF